MPLSEKRFEPEDGHVEFRQTSVSFPASSQIHNSQLQQPRLTGDGSDFYTADNESADYRPTLDEFNTGVFHDDSNSQLPIASYHPEYGQATGSWLASLRSGENFPGILNSPLSTAYLPSADNEYANLSTLNMEMYHNQPFTTPSTVGANADLYSEPGAFHPGQLNYHAQQLPLAGNIEPSLPRRRSRYFVSKSQNTSTPVYSSISGLDPLQRWAQFPPEEEPASVTAIMNAVADTPLTYRSTISSRGRRKTPSRSRRPRRSGSTTSRDSSASSTDSGWSSAADPSQTHAHRQKARPSKPKSASTKPRIFCCTFCCDRFGSKYEWVRHEKSLHVNLENWYCAPFGPSIASPETGNQLCVYCTAIDPSEGHLLEHDHEACQDESSERRSFRRKDHLAQHLRHVHQVQELPPLEDWKMEVKGITSRCGFCDLALEGWDDRVSHLAKHFHAGLTMKDWKGDHEFPPHVTAQLRNAYPPYLLGWESECIVPFSATNKDVQDQYTPLMATTLNTPNNELEPEPELPGFLDVFTRHLGKYARSQMELGILPTDEMFQKQARKVLFDSEDAWDQTIADNPDWLSAFRRLHLNNTNSSAGNQQHHTAQGASSQQNS